MNKKDDGIECNCGCVELAEMEEGFKVRTPTKDLVVVTYPDNIHPLQVDAVTLLQPKYARLFLGRMVIEVTGKQWTLDVKTLTTKEENVTRDFDIVDLFRMSSTLFSIFYGKR
jgi:hypothetical protein